MSLTPRGAAERAGLQVGDSILEVDRSPVGRFDGRVYDLPSRFDRSPGGTAELLVGFVESESGQVRYYYPEVTLDPRTARN